MKKLLCFLLCCSVFLFATACDSKTDSTAEINQLNDAEDFDKEKAASSFWDLFTLEEPTDSISNVFSYNALSHKNVSMLLAEFESFGQTVKVNGVDEYLFVNFKVVNDYCNRTDSGRMISVPVVLDTTSYNGSGVYEFAKVFTDGIQNKVTMSLQADTSYEYDAPPSSAAKDENGVVAATKEYWTVDEVQEIFKTSKRFVLYLSFMQGNIGINGETVFSETDDFNIPRLAEGFAIRNDKLFFVDDDDVVTQSRLIDALKKHNINADYFLKRYNYQDFFYEGIELQTFGENITKLCEKKVSDFSR